MYGTDDKTIFLDAFGQTHFLGNYIIFFSNVIVFDTTYYTNKYVMIFAPLIGVNYHKQSIKFGCGFVSAEKIVFHLVV